MNFFWKMFYFFSVSIFILNANLFAQNTSSPANKDTLHTIKIAANKSKLKKSYTIIIPASFIAYGCIAQGNNALKNLDKKVQTSITNKFSSPITTIDDYLQFSPAVAVYVLNAVGIKGKNNFKDRTIIFALSSIIASSSAIAVKNITKVERPDGSENNSFPSGHTTTTFASAEFMRQEYKDVSPWYGIAAYAAATTTGILRVYNNKHWVSDVVAGAGFGIISTKVAYWIYPSIKRKLFKNKSISGMASPYYSNGNIGLAVLYQFK